MPPAPFQPRTSPKVKEIFCFYFLKCLCRFRQLLSFDYENMYQKNTNTTRKLLRVKHEKTNKLYMIYSCCAFSCWVNHIIMLLNTADARNNVPCLLPQFSHHSPYNNKKRRNGNRSFCFAFYSFSFVGLIQFDFCLAKN